MGGARVASLYRRFGGRKVKQGARRTTDGMAVRGANAPEIVAPGMQVTGQDVIAATIRGIIHVTAHGAGNGAIVVMIHAEGIAIETAGAVAAHTAASPSGTKKSLASGSSWAEGNSAVFCHWE